MRYDDDRYERNRDFHDLDRDSFVDASEIDVRSEQSIGGGTSATEQSRTGDGKRRSA